MSNDIIKTLISFFINNIFYFISYLIPKSKNLWIFGAWYGEQYSDNCKYLFEYVNNNHPEIRAVWLTRNKKVLNSIKDKDFEAYLTSSFMGHFLSLRASIAIVSHSKLVDLNSYIGYKTRIIQLWHGIPLKKILYDNDLLGNRESEISKLMRKIGFEPESILNLTKIFLPFLIEDYSLIIATSEETKSRFSSAFRVKPEKIRITGYPRNDRLFTLNFLDKESEFYRIIYMPTFRGELGDDFSLLINSGFDIKMMDEFFQKKKIKFYIRLHPVNTIQNDIYECIKGTSSIYIFEEMDIYDYLNTFDCLITDYSSIYFDFLLLDKPIIFAPLDMDSYLSNDRRLYYEYDKVTPGPQANNWNEILKYIEDSIENPRRYANERKRVREMFHRYLDRESSRRVFEEIIKDISEIS